MRDKICLEKGIIFSSFYAYYKKIFSDKIYHTKNDCKIFILFFILHHDLLDGKVTNLEAVYKMTYFKIKTVISYTLGP